MQRIEKKKGNQSFVINVRSQENHTWQGTISWVEGKKQVNFRSALELMRLMDSVLSDDTEKGESLVNE
ncbi:hypothetical protein SAMN05216249_10774 [Acetitomaculum ruminis DSM 5522]|uniref:Uncharacterized protein n=1 Tax=Acetitomaculum ruminis DSM 5522 TaxID=1120918 RepID=A0A1I0XQC4_9FIRM|nr:hypothetical protein [Acetitomaculum ruminis]SFB03084.1 hypothetical protein SAMN05216249_10774 [Acetitomaculum ruminis DSM 5522]